MEFDKKELHSVLWLKDIKTAVAQPLSPNSLLQQAGMKIEESFVVNAPRETVWPLITDPKTLAKCVPGCESVDILSPVRYLGKVTVGLGPIRASFNVEVTITEQEAPSYVHCVSRGEENSRASMVSAENVMRLRDLGDGTTEVYYSSDIQVVGRLGKFGLGMMKKKAKTLGDAFAKAFKERVEGVPA